MLGGLKTAAAAAVAAGVMAVAIAAPAQAALKHYDGTVAKVGQSSFKLKTEGGRKLDFAVDGRTEFERIAGLDALSRGDRIEVDAKRDNGALIARQVEPQGGNGGGDNGGGHGGGNDDPPGHG